VTNRRSRYGDDSHHGGCRPHACVGRIDGLISKQGEKARICLCPGGKVKILDASECGQGVHDTLKYSGEYGEKDLTVLSIGPALNIFRIRLLDHEDDRAATRGTGTSAQAKISKLSSSRLQEMTKAMDREPGKSPQTRLVTIMCEENITARARRSVGLRTTC